MDLGWSARHLTRRQLLRALAATGASSLAGSAGYGYLFARHQVEVTRASLPVSGLPDNIVGLKIGLLTDLHYSQSVPAENIQAAVELLMNEKPDLIVLGGDYITAFDTRFAEPVAEILAALSAQHGVYAILGNHDDENIVPASLKAKKIQVLKDARTQISIRGEKLEIAGIRFWTRQPSKIAQVLRGASAPVLLLAHDPRRLVEAAELGVSLVLSGHTHGGQVALPIVGELVTRGRRFPALSGITRRDRTTMFISRGVGTVYLPIRLNCPPEAAILTLERMTDV